MKTHEPRTEEDRGVRRKLPDSRRWRRGPRRSPAHGCMHVFGDCESGYFAFCSDCGAGGTRAAGPEGARHALLNIPCHAGRADE